MIWQLKTLIFATTMTILTYMPYHVHQWCTLRPEEFLLEVEEESHSLLPSTVELVLTVGEVYAVDEGRDDAHRYQGIDDPWTADGYQEVSRDEQQEEQKGCDHAEKATRSEVTPFVVQLKQEIVKDS